MKAKHSLSKDGGRALAVPFTIEIMLPARNLCEAALNYSSCETRMPMIEPNVSALRREVISPMSMGEAKNGIVPCRSVGGLPVQISQKALDTS